MGTMCLNTSFQVPSAYTAMCEMQREAKKKYKKIYDDTSQYTSSLSVTKLTFKLSSNL